MQKEFVSRYTRYLDSIKSRSAQTEAEVKESAEYQQLDQEAKACEGCSPIEKPTKLQKEVDLIQKKLDAVTEPFQNQRGRLTVISYNIETASGSTKEKYRRQADSLKQSKVQVDLPSDDNGAVEKKSLSTTRRLKPCTTNCENGKLSALE